MKTHHVTVTATVSYQLVIEADSPEEAEAKALEIWGGDNGYTPEDWEKAYGTNWDDVLDVEAFTF